MAASELWGEATNIVLSWRPVAVVLFPMTAALVLAVLGVKKKRHIGFWAAVAGCITFLLVLFLLPLLREGVVEHRFADMMGLGLMFRVDLLGFIFAFLMSLAWMLVLVYASHYLQVEGFPVFYFPFALLTLGSCLGVVLTGDLVSLFLFFELMTFSSFVLVITRRDRPAMAAGKLYLYMGVAGGLILLFGIFAIFNAAGTVEIAPLMQELAGVEKTGLGIVFGCFFIGFGIKAGVVPLHFWMPKAYGAGPAVVNALSSGAMIKAGVYGILRVLLLILTPASLEWSELYSFALSSGYWVMWIGLLTMVAGALLALFQGHIMRLLAFSSISQVGYMITGLGAAAYLLGAEEAMGYSGAVLHAFNHTLYKTAFFLIAGIIFYRAGTLELGKLGGLAKKMPLLTAFFVLAALGIAGVPGLNGYISKTLVHDALLEAYKLYGGWDIYLAEKIFVAGSALTLCYYLKFFQKAFLGEETRARIRSAPWLLYAPLFVLGLFMLVVGLQPGFFVEDFVLASTYAFTFEPYGIEHVARLDFFSYQPLAAALTVIITAVAIYVPLYRWKLFDRELPAWFSVESMLMLPAARLFYQILCRMGVTLDHSVNRLYFGVGGKFLKFCRYVGSFDSNLDSFFEQSSRKVYRLMERSRELDDALNEAYEKTGSTARDFADRSSRLDGALNRAYESTGRAARGLADRTAHFDKALDKTYAATGRAARNLAEKTTRFDRALDKTYESSSKTAQKLAGKTLRLERVEVKEPAPTAAPDGREKAEAGDRKGRRPAFNPLEWNIKNINFDQLLMVLMLGIVIFILFYYGRALVDL